MTPKMQPITVGDLKKILNAIKDIDDSTGIGVVDEITGFVTLPASLLFSIDANLLVFKMLPYQTNIDKFSTGTPKSLWSIYKPNNTAE